MDGVGLLGHDLAHVDDVDGCVVAQVAQADGGVGEDIALADLEEASAGGEDGEAFFDGFSGEGVEDEVHTRAVGTIAVGDVADLVGEGGGA